MDPFLAWIETSELAMWVRGDSGGGEFVFPVIVTLHTMGMGFLAGGSTTIDLRILGVAPNIPLKPLRRFLPLLWLALAVNAVSGFLLLVAYPTKALSRIGAVVLRAPDVDQKPLDANAKLLAAASLAGWVALITAGRLLAYTHKWEMLGIPSLT